MVKNSKQVNLNTSVIATLDRIREQLPKRGSLKASYGDAIEWQKVTIELQSNKIQALNSEIAILKQKKARK